MMKTMQEIRKNELYQKDIKACADSITEWDALINKTILITGASGMIGTFLIDVLMYRNREFHNNIRVVAIGRNEAKAKDRFGMYWQDKEFLFISHDVCAPFQKPLYSEKPDFIIHGASNTHPLLYSTDPIGTIEANALGTRNLLESATEQINCRFVFLSSVEIYGENRGDTEFFSEDYCGYINCNTLRACYSESKRLGETLCQAYIFKHNIDVVIPRLSRVYGPTMHFSDTKAIAQLIKKAVAGEDIILKSEGKQLYSYVYIADAVSAILTIMLRGKKGEAYNIADKKSDMKLKSIAEYLAVLSANKVIFELPDEVEQKGYSTATKAILDSNKLRELGWNCIFTIQDGLRNTYEILKTRG